jgi:hypothetical protein
MVLKSSGHNALMLVQKQNVKIDLVNFLLAKGISPTETGSARG